MTKEEIEKYIRDTIMFFREIDKNSDEDYFKWCEDYIRKYLYKKYNIKE